MRVDGFYIGVFYNRECRNALPVFPSGAIMDLYGVFGATEGNMGKKGFQQFVFCTLGHSILFQQFRDICQ